MTFAPMIRTLQALLVLGLVASAMSADTPPTITTITNKTTAEDTATSSIGFTISDAQTPAASLTVSGASSNTALVDTPNMVFGGTTGSRTLVITPKPHQNGTTTITVTVSDGALTASTNFTLTVTSVPDAPTLTSVATLVGATEDIAYVIGYEELKAAANEDDVDSLTVNFRVQTVTNGSLGIRTADTTNTPTAVSLGNTILDSTKELVWTPAANANGTINAFTVRSHDGSLPSTTNIAVPVAVAAVNDAPTITTITAKTTAEDTATSSIAFTIADVETAASGLTVSGSSSNTVLVDTANMVFSGTTGSRTLVITPKLNQNGSANITVTVSDGTSTASTTFALTVTAANDAPTLTGADTITGGTEDVLLVITHATLTAKVTPYLNDVDSPMPTDFRIEAKSSGTLQIRTPPTTAWSSVTAQQTVFQPNQELGWTPAANANGTIQAFTIKARDSLNALSAPAVPIMVTVAAVNDAAPTITAITAKTTNEDTPTSSIAFTVADSETPAANLVVSGSSSNTALVDVGNMVFGGTTGSRTLVITPKSNKNGTALITVTVSDNVVPGALTASTNFTLTVVQVPDPPTLSKIDPIAGARENTDFVISYDTLLSNAKDENDPDNDVICFRIEGVTSGLLGVRLANSQSPATPVVAGSTILDATKELVWTPPAGSCGMHDAFWVKAYDGAYVSTPAVMTQIHVAPPNLSPTLTAIATLTGGLKDTPFIITYAAMQNAADEVDVDSPPVAYRITAVSSGTMGVRPAGSGNAPTAVVPNNTLLTENTELVWTPPAGATGVLAAGTFVAWDGALQSNPSVILSVDVSGAPQLAATTVLTEISTTGALSGGSVLSDGNSPVVERGVCWSTSPMPTTANPRTFDGTGSGAFTSTLTGLSPNQLYYVRAYATNQRGTAYASQLTFTTLATQAPSISTQPGSTTVSVGQTATFSVVATGTPAPTYQWQQSTDGGSTWQTISGATSSDYTTPIMVLADSGSRYRVEVSNSVSTAVSSSATLTVQAVGPSITGQPGNTSVQVGQTATFTVTASGTASFSYQWSRSTNGGTTWSPISGATTAGYTTPVTVLGDHGYQYRCEVTNAVASVTSSAATLSVLTAPPVPVITASSLYGQAPMTVTFSGTSSTDPNNDPLTYAWSVYTAGGSSTASGFNYTFNTPGDYEVWLTVSDGRSWVSTSVVVHVSAEVVNRITTPTTIAAADLSYDNEVLVVDGTTVTIIGPHTFAAGYIISNGTITSAATTASVDYKLDLTFTRNLTIALGSAMDVTGKGYLPGYAPSGITAATTNAGGSHGGYGLSYSGGIRNEVYGSFLQPTDLGAGSGSNGGAYAGGGAIRLTAETLEIHGAIRANGGGTATSRGGAGGSIWLQTTEIAGTGTITANGGGGSSSGGPFGVGGGGRIACYYTFADTADLRVDPSRFSAMGAKTGTSTAQAAGHGSIYLKKSDVAYAQSVWKNNGLRSQEPTPWWFGARSTTTDDPVAFETEFIGSGKGFLRLESTPCELSAVGAQPTLNDICLETHRLQAQNLTLANNAKLTSRPTTTSVEERLEISILAALTIDATSRIDVTARGYRPGYTKGSTGPTLTGGATKDAGGSHAGYGAIREFSGYPDTFNFGVRNEVYGSFLTPVDLGSGGGVAQAANPTVYTTPGGGAVKITAQTITNHGTIAADGGDRLNTPEWTSANACGSGGSVLLYTTTWGGNGLVSAKGGSGASGSGGGGRVALYYTQGSPNAALFSVCGGRDTSQTNYPIAGHGTIYWKQDAQSFGVILADNAGVRGEEPTKLWFGDAANETDDPVQYPIELRLTNKAWLDIASYSTETVLSGNTPTVNDAWLVADKISAASLALVQQASLSSHHTAAGRECRLQVTVPGTLSIDATSKIDVSGRGYLAGTSAPGVTAPTKMAGGSYGGRGSPGLNSSGVPDTFGFGFSNDVYGSFESPTDLGTGSGPDYFNADPRYNAARSGGGVVTMTIGSLMVDGQILADGGEASNSYGAKTNLTCAGSGGTIALHINTWSGNGIVRAKGGDAQNPGGGGRVVITYATTAPALNQVSAYGGWYGRVYSTLYPAAGSPGSVFVKRLGADWGALRFDNAGVSHLEATPIWFANRSDLFDDPPTYAMELVTGGNATIEYLGPTRLVLRGISPTILDATVRLERILASSLRIAGGGRIVPPITSSTVERKLDIVVVGDLTIDSDGMLNASETGYPRGYTYSVSGPTATGAASGRAGASHGGRGFLRAGNTGSTNANYGAFEMPTLLGSGSNPGSGSTYPGGGSIKVVAGRLIHSGKIEANGGMNPDRPYATTVASGSGGSIQINVGDLQGDGALEANGGDGDGGGGGGRIAVRHSTGFYSFSALARGGFYHSAAQPSVDCAGAGTILVRQNVLNIALLRLNNGGNTTSLSTPIWYGNRASPQSLFPATLYYEVINGALGSIEGALQTTNAAIDSDVDGLTDYRELTLGLNPASNDTNGDGITDRQSVEWGIDGAAQDHDDDGIVNGAEVAGGTDPFNHDSDGDGVADGVDAFPRDPSRTSAPTPQPGDVTPPQIWLDVPTDATPL
jgi:hypothetical protein